MKEELKHCLIVSSGVLLGLIIYTLIIVLLFRWYYSNNETSNVNIDDDYKDFKNETLDNELSELEDA